MTRRMRNREIKQLSMMRHASKNDDTSRWTATNTIRWFIKQYCTKPFNWYSIGKKGRLALRAILRGRSGCLFLLTSSILSLRHICKCCSSDGLHEKGVNSGQRGIVRLAGFKVACFSCQCLHDHHVAWTMSISGIQCLSPELAFRHTLMRGLHLEHFTPLCNA